MALNSLYCAVKQLLTHPLTHSLKRRGCPSENMSYKLYYFNGHGRAELIFAQTGVQYIGLTLLHQLNGSIKIYKKVH